MSVTDTLTPARTTLPEWFLDWWFAPWEYAPRFVSKTVGNTVSTSLLGRIDGYRFVCDEFAMPPDLPGGFDADWHVAALSDGATLVKAASLFAGLMAARERNMRILTQLDIEDRRWCLSTAMTQPLRALSGLCSADAIQEGDDPADTLTIIGLTELALRLEEAFPGIWPRLRLLLPEEDADAAEALLVHYQQQGCGAQAAALSAAAVRRAQKCWEYCCVRATSDS